MESVFSTCINSFAILFAVALLYCAKILITVSFCPTFVINLCDVYRLLKALLTAWLTVNLHK